MVVTRTASNLFQLSCLLTQKMTKKAAAEKEQTTNYIRNLYAFDLFVQLRFEESLNIFKELGTGTEPPPLIRPPLPPPSPHPQL